MEYILAEIIKDVSSDMPPPPFLSSVVKPTINYYANQCIR